MTCHLFPRHPSSSRVRAAACIVAAACLGLDGCAAPPPASATAAPAPVVTPTCVPPPVAGPLFLRGAMTNWALDDDYTFQYQCDSYVLNVDLIGTLGFRITDA